MMMCFTYGVNHRLCVFGCVWCATQMVRYPLPTRGGGGECVFGVMRIIIRPDIPRPARPPGPPPPPAVKGGGGSSTCISSSRSLAVQVVVLS